MCCAVMCLVGGGRRECPWPWQECAASLLSGSDGVCGRWGAVLLAGCQDTAHTQRDVLRRAAGGKGKGRRDCLDTGRVQSPGKCEFSILHLAQVSMEVVII